MTAKAWVNPQILQKPEDGVVTTRLSSMLEWALGWGRKNSLWPFPMGLACCAIEMMAVVGSRFDISRFGSEALRFSPRQSDLMLVSGTVSKKMAPAVKKLYDQMPEPKWAFAVGACASSGGMMNSYSTVQGVDEIIPVDMYISGCPPRPEAIIDGLILLQRRIQAGEPSALDRWKEVQAQGDAPPQRVAPPGTTAQNPVTYASLTYPRRRLPQHPEFSAARFNRY
ncbi:MAG: hypothetical protein Kow0062_01900 [Acidobacteriota bacterium]